MPNEIVYFAPVFEAYQDKCFGREYPKKLIVGQKYLDAFRLEHPDAYLDRKFLDADIVFDPREEEFRFE